MNDLSYKQFIALELAKVYISKMAEPHSGWSAEQVADIYNRIFKELQDCK